MTQQNEISQLVEFFRNKLGYVREDTLGKEIITRCPFCGDSVKSKNKGHLYINKETGIYNCFRCPASGHITYLLSFLEYNGSIPKFKDVSFSSKVNKEKRFKHKSKHIRFPECKDDRKFGYLLSRGYNLENNNDVYYRIIWNLDEFLKINNLTIPYQINPIFYVKLVEEYVGFLSYYGNIITLRSIKDKNNIRYFKLSLDYIEDYYAVNRIDYTTTFPHVVICEGTIDVYHAIQKLNLQNAIYVAAGTKFYQRCFRWTLLGFGITQCNLHIVLDSNRKYIRYRSFEKYSKQTKYYIPIEGSDIADCIAYAEI